MTETAGPQGGPPPSAGRGPWSEAFKRERGGGVEVLGGWVGGLTRLSAQTHIDHKWNLNLNTWNILSFKVKTTVMSLNVGKQR